MQVSYNQSNSYFYNDAAANCTSYVNSWSTPQGLAKPYPSTLRTQLVGATSKTLISVLRGIPIKNTHSSIKLTFKACLQKETLLKLNLKHIL